MKYIAYIRKSSEDKKRQIQSIPRQYEWCKKEADRRGFKISRFFEDSNSAHKLYRKGFKDMVEAIEASDEPIGIITWKISRLSRNPIDEGVVKYAFIRGKIKHIVARDREYKEHESQIIMGVDFGQATQFSIELSKDVKEGMNKKVSGGHRPTKAPYGYKNDPTGLKGEKKVFVDEEYFKPIQQFLKSYATGIYSISELQEKLTKQGVMAKNGKPFSLSTLYLILKRRFYCGEFLWNGKIKQGKHRPMISIEEHEIIQTLLTRGHKPCQNKYQNYYSGFITCHHCQSAITGYSKTKNNRIKGLTTYHYLKCGKKKGVCCPQTQLTRTEVDLKILHILKNLVIPEKIIDFILKNVENEICKEQSGNSYRLGQLQRKFNELDSEIETLGAEADERCHK
jgi:site-specific DNA recombinase